VKAKGEERSAGGFPGHVTAENIVQEQFSRNPKIVKVLYHWNYIEELGIGVDRMIRVMAEAGNPPPEFSTTGHTVTVTLRSALGARPVAAREAWAEGLNERQVKAVRYVQEHGRITNREYRELCGVGDTMATLELSKLVERGMLVRQGAGRAIIYTLPRGADNNRGLGD
jgi:ATP-dependent DNA helicase RecG